MMIDLSFIFVLLLILVICIVFLFHSADLKSLKEEYEDSTKLFIKKIQELQNNYDNLEMGKQSIISDFLSKLQEMSKERIILQFSDDQLYLIKSTETDLIFIKGSGLHIQILDKMNDYLHQKGLNVSLVLMPTDGELACFGIEKERDSVKYDNR